MLRATGLVLGSRVKPENDDEEEPEDDCGKVTENDNEEKWKITVRRGGG